MYSSSLNWSIDILPPFRYSTMPTPNLTYDNEPEDGFGFNKGYIKTVSGKLKALCMVNLIGGWFSLRFLIRINLLIISVNFFIIKYSFKDLFSRNKTCFQVFCILGFICVEIAENGDFSASYTGFVYGGTAMTGFCFSGIMLLMYLLQVVNTFKTIPWTKIECFSYIFLTIALLGASSEAMAEHIAFFTVAGVSPLYSVPKCR